MQLFSGESSQEISKIHHKINNKTAIMDVDFCPNNGCNLNVLEISPALKELQLTLRPVS